MLYVYEGKCVRKTNRIAKKQSQSRSRQGKSDEHVLYEIAYVEGDTAWRKWVKEEDLYVIIEDNELPLTQPSDTDDLLEFYMKQSD